MRNDAPAAAQGDLVRAFMALRDQCLSAANTMRRSTDPREVRAAARRFTELNARVGKMAPKLDGLGELGSIARGLHATGMALLAKAEPRALWLERNGADE